MLTPNAEWTGPVEIELAFYEEHTKTVRYEGEVGTQQIKYYAPMAILEKQDNQWPQKLRVILMSSDLPKKEIGFFGNLISPRTENGYWEYDLHKVNVNSIRYDVKFGQGNQTYSIYVPSSIFHQMAHPRRLLVYIATG